jgi:hypothetical protein
MELTIDSEQRMAELEGDDEMQSSRSSPAAQEKEGGARGRLTARRDSSGISQTLGDWREVSFICVPDSPAPPAKHQIERHALPPSANRAHAGGVARSALTSTSPCTPTHACAPALCHLGASSASLPLIPTGEA